jgi:hypothetical protein
MISKILRLCFVPRSGVQLIRDTRSAASRVVDVVGAEARDSRGRQNSPKCWDEAVSKSKTTAAKVRHIYLVFQLMAVCTLAFFCVGLYGVFVWKAPLPGIGCAFLSGIYYIKAALRLHQIRHRQLFSVKTYFARVTADPIELLPLGLPADWSLSKEERS